MYREPRKISLYSCGWADAADHAQTLGQGLVFDIAQVGYDQEEGGGRSGQRRPAARWENFGGEGTDLDEELEENEENCKVSD